MKTLADLNKKDYALLNLYFDDITTDLHHILTILENFLLMDLNLVTLLDCFQGKYSNLEDLYKDILASESDKSFEEWKKELYDDDDMLVVEVENCFYIFNFY